MKQGVVMVTNNWDNLGLIKNIIQTMSGCNGQDTSLELHPRCLITIEHRVLLHIKFHIGHEGCSR